MSISLILLWRTVLGLAMPGCGAGDAGCGGVLANQAKVGTANLSQLIVGDEIQVGSARDDDQYYALIERELGIVREAKPKVIAALPLRESVVPRAPSQSIPVYLPKSRRNRAVVAGDVGESGKLPLKITVSPGYALASGEEVAVSLSSRSGGTREVTLQLPTATANR